MGTPFFESIYLNRPTILIFNSKVHLDFDQRFLKFLKEFKKAKICFENPSEAASFLNINYKNLEKWWRDNKKQKILNEFCEYFCRKSKNLGEDFNNITKI